MTTDAFNQLVSDVLDLNTDSIDLNLKPGDVENWDSQKHVLLLMAAEESFGVAFSDQEMISVGSLQDLYDLIQRKLP
jgi:acyl carrier protein